jgi:hypothetical protein
MATHQPAGLRPSGTAGPTGSQTLFSGYMFDAPPSTAWEQASLAIGIEPSASGGTAWRVDGMALWLDPRPVPDTTTGGRLQVTVAGGCPSSDNGANDVTNTARGLTASLLPSGSPSAALLCEYNSASSGHPFALTLHRLLPASEAAHLADVARAVSLAHVDNGPHSCPAGDPGPIVLALRYPDGSNVALWVTPWICGGVSNGTIVASAFSNPTVDNLFAAIRTATG